jgi:hypothetical protein
MTLERGGGDTIAESTEVAGEDEDEGGNAAASGSSRTGNKLQDGDEDEDGEDDEEDENENDVTAQLQREMRDNTTVGFTTAIVPDAEGTRINLLGGEGQDEDSEMMDV